MAFTGSMDSNKDTWNSHLNCPLRNSLVPHGRPDVMYTLPELYETEDYISQVPVEDCDTCEVQCIHRSDIPCDEDIFTLCSHIMAQHQLRIPKDRFTALNLYLALRQELITVLNIVRLKHVKKPLALKSCYGQFNRQLYQIIIRVPFISQMF